MAVSEIVEIGKLHTTNKVGIPDEISTGEWGLKTR